MKARMEERIKNGARYPNVASFLRDELRLYRFLSGYKGRSEFQPTFLPFSDSKVNLAGTWDEEDPSSWAWKPQSNKRHSLESLGYALIAEARFVRLSPPDWTFDDGTVPLITFGEDGFYRPIAEAALRAAADGACLQSRKIRDADPAAAAAPVPADFPMSVVQRVRRMPSRSDLIAQSTAEDAVSTAVGYARRLMVAALVLVGLGLLFGLKVLVAPDTGALQATEQELLDLDRKVKEMKATELQRLRQNR